MDHEQSMVLVTVQIVTPIVELNDTGQGASSLPDHPTVVPHVNTTNTVFKLHPMYTSSRRDLSWSDCDSH